jgi:hypothetical protein
MLSLVSDPLTPLLLARFFAGQVSSEEVHMDTVMGDANLIDLPDDHFKHPGPKFISPIGFSDNICLVSVEGLPRWTHRFSYKRLLTCVPIIFPDLLNPSTR